MDDNVSQTSQNRKINKIEKGGTKGLHMLIDIQGKAF